MDKFLDNTHKIIWLYRLFMDHPGGVYNKEGEV